MSIRNAVLATATPAASLFGLPAPALADGRATPWQFGMQDAVTPVMERINDFHNMLLVIITAIAAFVILLLLYVLYRFRESNNPIPSKTSHNTLIEVLWTVVPIMILVVIAIPSFKLLYFSDRVPAAEARKAGADVINIKAVGNQWYWVYEYQTDRAGNGFRFESRIACRGVPASEGSKKTDCDEFKADKGYAPIRLLDVDNRIVVPMGGYIRLTTTAAQVIHSWAVPAFGVKIDAVPGRLNETWFQANKIGVYYGVCSELCGVDHGFMPIAVQVVSKADYKAWVAKALKNDDFERIKAPAGKKTAGTKKTSQTAAR